MTKKKTDKQLLYEYIGLSITYWEKRHKIEILKAQMEKIEEKQKKIRVLWGTDK